MLAIELSTSSDWAREMRGTASIASAVIGRRPSSSTSSGFSAGLSRLTSVAPSASRAISARLRGVHLEDDVGRPGVGRDRAPAAAYASSVKPAASPAPGSTTTS